MRLVEMPVMNLKPGMFIAELDRPWLDTPFSIQGFVVRDDDDIMFVAKHVDRVYVDVHYRGSAISLGDMPTEDPGLPGGTLQLKADFNQARISFESATSALNNVFDSLHSGNGADINPVKDAIRPLIDGVFKNKEAVAALARLKESGEYRYNHSIAMSIWAAILGRHIGLHITELEKLVVGCAMCDIGMTKLPATLLENPEGLTHEQADLVHGHTQLGSELVQSTLAVDIEVLTIIENHHERHNGSGYPNGLDGNAIPLLARIAGLVDTYDAMISPRPYAVSRSSFEATQELIDSKNQLFQGALVEQFVQAIGLFPVSSLVEMNTGEVAIVVKQNATRRLKPEVLVVLDADKEEKDEMDLIDLAAVSMVGDDARWIVRELAPGSYGVNSEDHFI